MQRTFIQDAGRWKAGTTVEWPLTTWKAFFPNWKKITAPTEMVAAEAVEETPPRRGRGRPRKEEVLNG